MAKLKKQVKRTKEILSAYTPPPISVESLYNDIDFRSTITREQFEELCADLWEQALSPIKDVLTQSGMKIGDVYAVELIGGATRVPKLQAKLQEFLGWSELDKQHLDVDEAIVLGASLHAANLSDGIKLSCKLGMIDGSTYGFVFEIDGPDYVKDESTDEVLVPRMKKMPMKGWVRVCCWIQHFFVDGCRLLMLLTVGLLGSVVVVVVLIVMIFVYSPITVMQKIPAPREVITVDCACILAMTTTINFRV
ncbi:unnamed protein product [Triticum turgidum subsp. durum]|uniref:Uncharacterized protein n=1 Tax=Triticum turgidum subsp. durum TaxID=4567 RepID=A0A9R0V7R5_TRITD|nr:unnamed protein product [Triticum turgidum subsp. durum]